MNLHKLLILVLLSLSHVGIAQDTGFTFAVDDVKPASFRLNEVAFDVFVNDRFSKKVYSFPQEMRGKNIVANHGNGFLSTVKFAYNDHRPLELSPDDIWLVLCQSFGDHVTANKDSLENLLLKEDHPEIITIRNDKLTHSDDAEWSNVMTSLSDEIDAMSKDEFRNLVVQEYSTTTKTISTVYRATHMDITSHYVKYNVVTMCGFPSITLLGTPDDWKKIYEKVDGFSEFGLAHWVEELKPVLHEFVVASEGNPNIDFWKSFYKTVTVYDTDVISGWILKFYPYIRKTRNGEDSYSPNPYLEGSNYLLSEIGDESLPKGRKETEFQWTCLKDSVFTESLMLFSGFYGILQDEETGAVRPNIAWIITSSESIKEPFDSNYSIYRQKSKRDGEEPRYPWVPELTGEARYKPVYQPEKYSSFEESVASIQQDLIRSGLFKKNDHPKIKVCIAYEGTLIVQSIEDVNEKQEKFILELLENTSGKWSPAKDYYGTVPLNYVFIITI